MNIVQAAHEVVNIASWQGEEESRIFPVGSRDKILVYCPSPPPFPFLIQSHRYLFKQSVKKCPEQFWIEIFAYQLGKRMQVPVAQTFAAYDEKENQYGALISWFLQKHRPAGAYEDIEEQYDSGGDLLQGYIQDFDHKKGSKHNFSTISEIFREKYHQTNWQQHWARIFIFDALIGNTDRHQDNWGIIHGLDGKIHLTPAFDNGTSMGYEIKSDKFEKYEDNASLKRYVLKGTHHPRWHLDQPRSQHASFLKKYIDTYPDTHATIMTCLKNVDSESFKCILGELTAFQTDMCLTKERAEFMLKLLEFRHHMLLNELG